VKAAITTIAIERLRISGSPQPKSPGKARLKYSLKPSDDAANGAEKPTKNDTQPLRKPNAGWNNVDR
jgi:hypothetical protein